ncbi:MAG: FAD-dependent oxidoreductase [Deltaproteobacteria bacterium]|nr:FAD-dependent oxidoreductase [Deltaproteobacteria bacterium]
MSVELSIDGRRVAAEVDESILDVAARLGARIPTLCHDPRISPEVSCWVCVVEVRRGGRSPINELAAPGLGEFHLEPSCATRVAAEMEVRTDSEAVRSVRRTALELLMSDHDADCVAPCVLECPASVDVPRYVERVRRGDYGGAVRAVRATNPLPGVCGRVCPHPCEDVCTRGLVDGPVAINSLKRLAVELGSESPTQPEADTGKHVAIIGAGPAGLSAAAALRLAGHRVTVLDSRAKPGGMLRYAIPAYRLPREVLDADLRHIAALGVELELGVVLGPDLLLGELIGDRATNPHDAVFLAMGAWRQRRLGLPNEDAAGALTSLDLLRWFHEGQLSALGGRVAVIGGGNSAVDAARTARRLGSERVTIFYRRTRDHMPAFRAEVDAALEEGIELECLAAPEAIEVRQGRVSGIRISRMRLGPPDESGRPRPILIPGSEQVYPADWVVSAVGELPDPIASRGLVDPRTQATPIPGLFAGGDFVVGPSTVVEAIASGRRAAVAIDRFLRRDPSPLSAQPVTSRRAALRTLEGSSFTHVETVERAHERAISPVVRTSDFREVICGLSEEEGRREASRCLQCGCSSFATCALRPLLDTYGVATARYRGALHDARPRFLRPGLQLEMNKCIRCHRCVSLCRELARAEVLTFVERGFATRLEYAACSDGTAREACDRCFSNGALCVDTCPTGALTLEG